MCFGEHLSSAGVWCWTEILSCVRDWGKKKKAKFFPACVSDEATKPCFISALGKIFALISSKQAHFYASPTRPQRCDPRFCLLQVQKHKLKCDTETFTHTHTHTPILLPSKASQTPLRQTGCSHNIKSTAGCSIKHRCMRFLTDKRRSLRVCVCASRSSRSWSRQCKRFPAFLWGAE